MNYYYVTDGETYGPINLEDLRELLRSGQVSRDTQVCSEGAESWQPISDLIEIDEAEVSETTPPPVPRIVKPEQIVRAPVVAPPVKTWEYAVVPFVAVIGHTQGAAAASTRLEALIRDRANTGWEYVRLENVETLVEGDNGCFGIGGTPPHTTAYSMAVFRR